jgi:hypothetical protein
MGLAKTTTARHAGIEDIGIKQLSHAQSPMLSLVARCEQQAPWRLRAHGQSVGIAVPGHSSKVCRDKSTKCGLYYGSAVYVVTSE